MSLTVFVSNIYTWFYGTNKKKKGQFTIIEANLLLDSLITYLGTHGRFVCASTLANIQFQ